jgi:hypothetical protein
VVEQQGVVRELLDGVEQAAPYLDIRSKVLAGGERGLLSMAIDPADPTQAYVYYTAKSDGHIQIDRYTAPTPDGANAASGTSVVSIPHPGNENHNGGQLQFGPDGKLYAATGDGGDGGDSHHNAQKLDAATSTSDPRLGKLLRVNPNGTAPADNPFPAPADLVWALGLRNPWRFSFDRLTGALAVGDVGQGAWEEVDYAPAPTAARAVNYGWNMREGLHPYVTPNPDTPGPNCCTDPVLEHGHGAGWFAIIGGYVVRDPDVPEMAGRYMYGDNAKGDLYAATLSATGVSGDGPTGLHVASLSGFGEDAVGHIYAASLNGPVYRLAGDAAPPQPQQPTGGSPGPGTDTAPPRLTLVIARRQHVLRTKRFVAKIGCDEQCTLRVAAKRAKTRRRTAAAGARLRIVLRPSRAALRGWAGAVRRHHRVVVRLRVRATDAAGNATSRSVRVRVVR